MNPLAFAEVARLLRKKRTTKAESAKIVLAYECLIALFGKDQVDYLVRLVNRDQQR